MVMVMVMVVLQLDEELDEDCLLCDLVSLCQGSLISATLSHCSLLSLLLASI
jgi:hypothetical protein